MLYKQPARHMRKPAELMLVPMIDIFTVMVTFLLMTAVFSRITTLELDLPSAAAGKVTEPTFRLEAVVRKNGFELTNGSAVIAAVPKVNGAYDLKTLSDLAVSIKRDHPDVNDASVLLEPEVAYDDLIQVMDTLRRAEVPVATDPALAVAESGVQRSAGETDPNLTTLVLFTNIAVGDAP
jgi:biopolymer transport protein ExbD